MKRTRRGFFGVALGIVMVAAGALATSGCGTAATTGGATTEALRVNLLTFNLRYGTAPDGPNVWANRRDIAFDVMRHSQADFIGFQEALPSQITEIAQALPGYAWVTRSREVDETRGEAVPIFYRKDRWQMTTSGTFWLSETPETPGSKTWGNTLPRVATWGRFVEKGTGRPVFVFNVHLDHQSQPAREKGTALVLQRMSDVTKDAAARDCRMPALALMGDFNSGEDNPVVQYAKGQGATPPMTLVDTFRVAHPDAKEIGTTHNWAGKVSTEKIDYIFTLPGVKVLRADIIRDNKDGRYPTDHFPVMAEVAF